MGAVRRVVFVNRYFHPDHSATSQIASDLAFHLVRRGWDVAVITGRQRYDDSNARLAARETAHGVQIVRVWSTRFGRAMLAGRAIDYATFYLSAFFAMLARTRRGSVIVALTDPPLISVVAAIAATLRGARLVNWLQDLFPEVAEALGMPSLRVLRGPRNWSLRRARRNVVLGDRMAERVPNARTIHNWADADLHPVPRRAEEHLVAGYSGNLGRAHDADTILAAMRLLPDVRFVFTGGGAQLDRVRREAGSNLSFRPYAPREQLSESLSSMDVHLVTLQPSMEGLIVPSKFYGILAVARPVIFIGAKDGELARLIVASGCGYVVAPGDSEGLTLILRELANDRERAREMGRRGLTLYQERFAPARPFSEWEAVLEEAAR
jgi:glycosyltransferase involved in cell wall biosynthesis